MDEKSIKVAHLLAKACSLCEDKHLSFDDDMVFSITTILKAMINKQELNAPEMQIKIVMLNRFNDAIRDNLHDQ
jgi:hypothetical protein